MSSTALAWTLEEDAVLKRLHEAGFDWNTCAAALARTAKACASRWRGLNRKKPGAVPWTAEEDETLRALLAKGLSWADAAEALPGRSPRACAARGKAIGAAPLKSRLKRPGALSLRRCHDCGKATADYRCPRCLAKWRAKHGVGPSAQEDETYSAFGARNAFD